LPPNVKQSRRGRVFTNNAQQVAPDAEKNHLSAEQCYFAADLSNNLCLHILRLWDIIPPSALEEGFHASVGAHVNILGGGWNYRLFGIRRM
jgi:hypothetical protein